MVETPEVVKTDPAEKSILRTVKKMLGIGEDYTVFDDELITYINSSFMTLNQLSIGPEDGYLIADSEVKWSDVFDNLKLMPALQTYIYSYVKLLFDPPATGHAEDSLREIQKEVLWRLNVQSETERTENL